jgi:hypothetical protein
MLYREALEKYGTAKVCLGRVRAAAFQMVDAPALLRCAPLNGVCKFLRGVTVKACGAAGSAGKA